MKYRILALITALITVLTLLAGCGGSQKKEPVSDESGAAVTLLKDDIETKRGMLTAGIHLIGGISGVLPLKYFDGSQLNDAAYNVYITPYVEVPLTPTSKAEAMAQIGMRDIAGERKLDFKVLVSARKVF